MFATTKSKDQRGRGRSTAGAAGPPSLVAGERGGRPWAGRLTSPGRSQKTARRTSRTAQEPVGKGAHGQGHPSVGGRRRVQVRAGQAEVGLGEAVEVLLAGAAQAGLPEQVRVGRAGA